MYLASFKVSTKGSPAKLKLVLNNNGTPVSNSSNVTAMQSISILQIIPSTLRHTDDNTITMKNSAGIVELKPGQIININYINCRFSSRVIVE